MSLPLHALSIAEAGALIRQRRLSPVEYTDHLIARIETFDAQLHAFITPTFEWARRRARDAEAELMRGQYLGPLHGIPFGVKDIFETAGIPTTGGSRLAIDHVPQRDAAVIARLYDSGAVLLGKLATHEFAHGGPSFDLPWPVARNPWDLARFTGGSSSGSAAAVAAGLLPAALGSDTGGSVRGPASLCGITGLLPSSGRVSRTGVLPNSYTLDHCGPMAGTAEDCALLLQAMAGHDPSDGNSLERPIPDYPRQLDGGIKNLRIGVLRHIWEEDLHCDDEHRRALDDAVDTLRRLGAHVETCRIQPMQAYLDVKIIIGESEIFSVYHQQLIERPGDFGRDFLTRILPAVLFQSSDYLAASREQRRMVAGMQPLYGKYDLLFAPGPGAAPLISTQHPLQFWRRPNPHAFANVVGAPALALCCGYSTTGLPLGMQLIGPPFSDADVLRAGHAYEQATQWRQRRPALAPGVQAPPITPPDLTPDTAACDAGTRELAAGLAVKAGLRLNEQQYQVLFEAAPYALAMAGRLRKPRPWHDAPAHAPRFSA